MIPIYSIIPFILMLLSIASLPLFIADFWDKNTNKLIIALALSFPVALWLIINGHSNELYHTLVFDYIPFIILLGGLFIVSGGIFIDGDIEAKPLTNTTFLAIGGVLASLIGTTGASMLLIRPLLNTNRERELKTHTVLFFIAVVANCGGLLTPLGDPPLFMIYLRGVPFEWFLKLIPEWLFANLVLLSIYYFVDSYYFKKETTYSIIKDKTNIKPITTEGKINFIFILGIIFSVAFLNNKVIPFLSENHYFQFIREIVIILMAILSLYFTSKKVRESNNFNWHPIIEVAYLFIGIFITMVPCILYLQYNANSLGVDTASKFYYYSGLLSSFLDNTPTAVTFYSLAEGLSKSSEAFNNMTLLGNIPEVFIKGISVGSVFFGAITYIGNGPNFMVKTIAEANNVKMPHFFEYIYKFSLIILLPLYILIQFLFI